MQTKSISCLSIGADGRSAKSVRTSRTVKWTVRASSVIASWQSPHTRPDTTYRTANRRTPLRSMR